LNIFDNHIAIGKILKPAGLKGKVKVTSLSDYPERFFDTKIVKIFDEFNDSFIVNPLTGDFFISVESVEVFGKFFKIKFKEFNSIDESERLRNCIILIPESEKVKIDKGEYFMYELVELEVYEDDRYIGMITKIENYGAQDLLFVESPEGKEYMIPYVDEFILDVDLKNKKINIKSIEGLLD